MNTAEHTNSIHIPNPDLSPPTNVIKVANDSRSTAVAGAIAGVIREHQHAEVQAIGAGAVYQAVKALAIARSYLAQETDITLVPIFTDVMINGQERTAIRFIIDTKAFE